MIIVMKQKFSEYNLRNVINTIEGLGLTAHLSRGENTTLIGVVGDKDSVLAFKAIGIDVFPVVEADEARIAVDKMAMNGYAVIFITEQVAVTIEETIERYNKQMLPAVILIPSNQGTLNIGSKRISDSVEKAVGVNIL